MPITNSTKARTHFFKLIEEVNVTHDPVFITGKKVNAVLISEEDFNAMQGKLSGAYSRRINQKHRLV